MTHKKELIDKFVLEFNSAKNKIADLQKSYSEKAFSQKPGENQWSAAECIEHLNITNRGYINNARKQLHESQQSEVSNNNYKPRFLVTKFINMMKPTAKMKFKAPGKLKQSFDGNLDETVEQFIKIQDEYIELANTSLNYDLKKVKVVSPVSKLLKFELGEMFMAMIEHQKRHLAQAERALESAE